MTSAGNLETLANLQGNVRHTFVQSDICAAELVSSLLTRHKPRAVINFAAKSRVDSSIYSPGEFVQTNIVGTVRLLEAVRAYWKDLQLNAKTGFRFLHVSTDEVYGAFGPGKAAFSEPTPTNPAALTAPARLPATTWCAPGTTPMVCRCSPLTAATITVRSTFLKNSFH